ncbi:MAG: DUF1772 domain-containing protein [Salinarimonas sp.]|nr:DUF1772 domain-containing protein [Salinarimonas sp.]
MRAHSLALALAPALAPALASTLLFSLMAGFFFAFAAVVMPGLDRMPPADAALAMQAINAGVANPVFALGFWGAALIAAISLPVAVIGRRPGWPWLCAAAASYLVGVLMVTATGNVPLNQELAAIAQPEALQRAWPEYLADWGWLNALRTIAALVSAGLALCALIVAMQGQRRHGAGAA